MQKSLKINIEEEIQKIQERNERVEADKAWETSSARKVLIFVLTYLVIVVFFFAAGLPNPFVNSVVPAVGFLLSTLTIPLFKGYWIKNFYKK